MRGLIYKDLYLIRHRFITCMIMVALVIVMLIIIAALPGDFPAPVAPVIAIFINVYIVFLFPVVLYSEIMKKDTKKEWSYYSITIPGAEDEVIAAKYTVVFIVYFLSYALCTVIDIFAGILFNERVDSSTVVLAVILFNILLNAIEMPLCYRFGVDKGSHIRVAITLILALVVVIYLLFGNLEWAMGQDGIFWVIKDAMDKDLNIMNVAYYQASKSLKKLALYEVIIASLLPHVVVIIYFISYRISCRVYKKGVVR